MVLTSRHALTGRCDELDPPRIVELQRFGEHANGKRTRSLPTTSLKGGDGISADPGSVSELFLREPYSETMLPE